MVSRKSTPAGGVSRQIDAAFCTRSSPLEVRCEEAETVTGAAWRRERSEAMSESSTPLSADRRTRGTRRAPSRGKRHIRRAPESPVAAFLGAARDHRLAQEIERLERFTREFKELQRAVHELLTSAAEARLEAEAARLERALEDEAARAAARRAILAA